MNLGRASFTLLLFFGLLMPGRVQGAAYALNTYAAYEDSPTFANNVGQLHLYTGKNTTSFQVTEVNAPLTNIAAGTVVLSGLNIAPYQPITPLTGLTTSYFQISSTQPMNGLILDPLVQTGSDQADMVVSADTNSYLGGVFLIYMRYCQAQPANVSYGDDLAVINPSSSTAITATITRWNSGSSTWSGTVTGSESMTSPSIPPLGVWMWSPSTTGALNSDSGGTILADTGDYKITVNGGAQAMLYYGDNYSPTDRNDIALQAADRVSGLKVGTDLIGAGDYRMASNGSGNSNVCVTVADQTGAANQFSVQYLAPTVAMPGGSQWPISGASPTNSWQPVAGWQNIALAANGVAFVPYTAFPYGSYFRVVATGAVSSWMGIAPLANNFSGGSYMDSDNGGLISTVGTLFKWALESGSGGAGNTGAHYIDVIAPQPGTSATLSINNVQAGPITIAPSATQSNAGAGPEVLRFQLNDSSAPDQYRGQLSATNNVYAFALSIGPAGSPSAGENLYSIPYPNLSQLVTAKSVNVSTAAPGDTITYVLTASNFSSSAMLNCRVWDTLPPDLTYASSTPAFSSGPPPSNYYLWNLGSLAGGASVSITIAAAVTTGFNGDVEHNTASGDNSTNNPYTSADAPFIISIPGVNLQKSANVSTASPGDTVTYTLDYFNSAACPPAAPNLSLLEEATTISGQHVYYTFEILNNSGAPVNINGMRIAYWLDDAASIAGITANNWYGGNVSSPGSTPAWSAAISNMGPVLRPDSHDANIAVAWTASTGAGNQIPAGGSITGIQMDLSGPNSSFFNTASQSTLYYSRVTSAAYVSDTHFALYYDNAGVWSLASGCEPQNWVQVDDTVPAQMNFVSATAGATFSSGVVSWFLPCVQCQQTELLNWWGTVKAGTAGGTVINNQADYSSNTTVGLSNLATVVVPSLGSPTFTPSSSPTRSPTQTLTATPTPSPSSTPTLSRTPTLTASPSSTLSATPTATPSKTQTVTLTATTTVTPTSTLTDTRSATPSITNTNTPGPSPTPSDTPTQTPSATPSSTVTFTPTETLSSTPTPTATPSSTASPTSTVSPVYSPTDSPTDTPSSTSTPSFSDTATPSATPSQTPSFTPTASFSFTDTGTPTWTVTPTFTQTQSLSFTPTFTPSATASPSWTPSPSISPTLAAVPFFVTVSVYNSAGERVRQLFSGSTTQGVQAISLGPLITGGVLSGTTISGIASPALSGPLVWNWKNDGGQPVSSGVYYIKVETKDPFGSVSAITSPVAVLAPPTPGDFCIFNSAGEIVRDLPLSAYGVAIDNFSLKTHGQPGMLSPTAAAEVTFVDVQGGLHVWDWDGTNGLGSPLQSGSYEMRLSNSGVVKTASVSLLQAPLPDPLAGALLGPNPVGLHGLSILQLSYVPHAGTSVQARLYSMDGELLGSFSPSGSGRLAFDVGKLSAGICMAVLEARQGQATVSLRILKVAILK